MKVPPANHTLWSDIVSGKVKFNFDFLAAKILQSTLARELAKNPSAANLMKCAHEFRELFAQNADLPSAQRDLKNIFG